MSPTPRFVKAQTQPVPSPAPRTQDDDPFDPPKAAQDESDTELKSDEEKAVVPGTTTTVTSGVPPTQSSNQGSMVYATDGRLPSGPTIPDLLRPEYEMTPRGISQWGIDFPLKPAQTQIRRTPEQYEAEYWEYAVKDPAKRTWLAKRAIALGYAQYDPKAPNGLVKESEFNATGGGSGIYRMWTEYGTIARMNPALNLLTPEQLMDQRYNFLGGDTAFDQLAKSSIPNPIQKTTQTSTVSMSQTEADTIADGVAMAVLGHMADDASMKRARKAMNSLMARNPTVSTTISDNTNPDSQVVTTNTKSGIGAQEAAQAYEMKLRRSSEGMAFNVGKLMENAMTLLDRGL